MSTAPAQTVEIDAMDADDNDTSVLQVIDLHGFATRDLLPPEFVVDSIIPRGQVTLLGGHGGVGKSILALTIEAHFAASREWAGFKSVGGRAVYLSLEDGPDLVQWRLRRVVDAYGLDPEPIERNLVLIDGTDGDGALAVEASDYGIRRLVATANMHTLHELVGDAGLIVVDNASDAFDGDENSRRMVRTFVRRLARLARECNAGILLLAHVDKTAARHGGNGNSYSGSTAWHNSARSRLALVERDGSLELVHEKANLAKRHAPIALQFDDNGILVPRDGDSPSARAGDVDDDKAVLATIAAANAARVDVPFARRGPATTQSILETFSEFPETLAGKAGRRRLWLALDRLRRRGCVSFDVYLDARRHERTRLIARVPA